MILYHGSNDYYPVLEPHISTHGKAAVYASPNITHALCFAGNKWTDKILNMSYYDGILYLIELEKDILNETYNRPGYLYQIDDKDNQFEYVRNNSPNELWSFEIIHYSKVTYLTNILNELRNSSIILYTFPDKPKWWKRYKERE